MNTSTNMTMQVPAHIAARIAARQAGAAPQSQVASAITSGDGFPYPRISIRAGRYRLVDQGVETVVGTELDVIIVRSNPRVSKIFFSKPYDPNATDARPDCVSSDGLKPDEGIERPFHTSCATCPNNVLGSKVTPTGAKSKLCADQRHIAVVPSADPSKVYSLTIPVSGMKGLREYIKGLGNFNFMPEEVVTTLGFDDQTSYPRVTFAHKAFPSDAACAKVDALTQEAVLQEITREVPVGTFNPQHALKGPTAHAQIAAPAAAAPAAAAPVAAAPVAAAPVVAAPVAAAPAAVDEDYADDAVTVVQAGGDLTDLEKALDGLFS